MLFFQEMCLPQAFHQPLTVSSSPRAKPLLPFLLIRDARAHEQKGKLSVSPSANMSNSSTRRSESVTMSDIARHAGVSRPTVSIVLNNRHEKIGIALETRE